MYIHIQSNSLGFLASHIYIYIYTVYVYVYTPLLVDNFSRLPWHVYIRHGVYLCVNSGESLPPLRGVTYINDMENATDDAVNVKEIWERGAMPS